MKSSKKNLMICFQKLDDQLGSIDTSPNDENTRTPDGQFVRAAGRSWRVWI